MKNYGSILRSKLIRDVGSNRLITNPHITIKTKTRSRQLHPMSSILDTSNNEPSIKTQYEKYKKPQNILINNTFNIISNTSSTINSNNNSKHHYSKVNSKKNKFPQKKDLIKKLRDISLVAKFKYLKDFKGFNISNNNSHCISKNNSHFNSIKNTDLKLNIEHKKSNIKKNCKLPKQYMSLNIDLSHQATQSRNTKNNSFSKEEEDNKKKTKSNITCNNSNNRLVNTSGNNTALNTGKKKYEIKKSPITINSKTINYHNKFNMNKKLYRNIFNASSNSNLILNKKRNLNNNSKKHPKKIFFYTYTTSPIKLNKNKKQNDNKKNIRNTEENSENYNYLNYKSKKNQSSIFLRSKSKKNRNKGSQTHKNKQISKPKNGINKNNNKELLKKIRLNKKCLNINSRVSGKLYDKNIKNIKKEITRPISNKNISPKDNNYIVKNKNNIFINNKDIMFNFIKNIFLINSNKSLKNSKNEQNKKFLKFKKNINRNDNFHFKLKTSYQILKTENYDLCDNNFNYENNNIIINDDSIRQNELIPSRFSVKQLQESKNTNNNKEKDLDETESPLFPITETTNNDVNNSALTYNEVKDIIIYYDMDDINIARKDYLFKKNSEKMFKVNSMDKYEYFFFGK